MLSNTGRFVDRNPGITAVSEEVKQFDFTNKETVVEDKEKRKSYLQ